MNREYPCEKQRDEQGETHAYSPQGKMDRLRPLPLTLRVRETGRFNSGIPQMMFSEFVLQKPQCHSNAGSGKSKVPVYPFAEVPGNNRCSRCSYINTHEKN